MKSLDLLRAELKDRDLDGFIIPRTDEFQSEYIAKSAERLAYISGFTGSAGTGVVLSNKAALFVDGRYILQAKEQAKDFEICHYTENPMTNWLMSNVGEDQRIGFDPWLHTKDRIDEIKKVFNFKNVELVECMINPVDAIWEGQPRDEKKPFFIQDVEYSGVSHEKKIIDIADLIKKDGFDAAVLTDPASIAWLLNIRGQDVPFTPLPQAFAIVYEDAHVKLFADIEKVTDELRDHLGFNVELFEKSMMSDALSELGYDSAKVLFDKSKAPLLMLNRLEKSGAEVEFGDDPCLILKACKNQVEINGAKNAHVRDGVAMVRFLKWFEENAIKGSLDEISASDKLLEFRKQGDKFFGLSFPTISAAGSNGAIVHYFPTAKSNKKIVSDMIYLVDSGAQYRDGTTDITRTLPVGEVSELQMRRFTQVLKGHIAVVSARFPKKTCGESLDVLARAYLWQDGADYDHGTGHGVGSFLSVHEGPQRISKKGNGQELLPGMILSVEPGFYQEGEFGIRIENLVLVQEDKDENGLANGMLSFDVLTYVPIDKNMIKIELLDKQEINWLNVYHKLVFDKLSPYLKGEEKDWLSEKTKPIII